MCVCLHSLETIKHRFPFNTILNNCEIEKKRGEQAYSESPSSGIKIILYKQILQTTHNIITVFLQRLVLVREADGVRDGTGHTLAGRAMSSRPQTQTVKSTEDLQTVQDTLLVGSLMIGGASAGGRKTEVHHHDDGHKPQHHQAISKLIHLLLTIGSAFDLLGGCYCQAAVDRRRQRDIVGHSIDSGI